MSAHPLFVGVSLLLAFGVGACSCDPVHPCLDKVHPRASAIPGDVQKGSPDNDFFPPTLHSSEFEPPVPMPGPITTAGAEDSPFHSPDGASPVFFFAPDARVPVEQQVQDCTVGLWRAEREGDGWGEPQNLGPEVNGPGDQAFPYVTPDGEELFFGQNSAQGGTAPCGRPTAAGARPRRSSPTSPASPISTPTATSSSCTTT